MLINFFQNCCDAIDGNRDGARNEIRVATQRIQDRISVKISDTGCGIPEDRIHAVFEFGTSSKGSSGFGLYYCKTYIEANKGTLAIESPGPGRGATVTMTFPAGGDQP